ncbi:MAG: BrnA antitoxin family protein [Caldilineales bacterium]|nr:BrnA antitoxin family protein [Caldilineales bacterium]MCW5860133.1 hypothetical protein [Caldilineales bacterium]
MNERNIPKASATDWEHLERMADDDIDYSDIPPLGDDFFARARVYVPRAVRPNSVELDQDVLTWFRGRDKQHPNLINAILRKYIEIQQETAA